MREIAQLVGLIFIGASLVAYQLKQRKHIVLMFCFMNLIGFVHYLMLGGALSAAFIFVVGLAQSVTSYITAVLDKKPSKVQMVIFAVLYTAVAITTYRSYVDILSIAASFMCMCSMFQTDEQKIRIFSLMNAGCWIVYNILVRSVSVVAQILTFISISIALYRYKKTLSANNNQMLNEIK